MKELIELIQTYIDNHEDLPIVVGEYETINISDEFLSYFVDGSCRVELVRIDREEDEPNFYAYRYKFELNKVDCTDADGEWHELPKSQVRELQMELNKSI